MPASTPTALHRPEMPVATENKEMNAEATTPAAKDGAKTEANRKKKERQKAKARAEKAAAQETIAGVLPSAEAVAAGAANASTTRSERRHAGENMPGEDRGLGMFATEAVSAADVIASATPALSVVFDECVDEVCGFCFKCEEPSQTEEAVVLQRSATGFGLILDDRRSWTGGAALIAGVVKGGPNSGAVFIGDRIVSIDGTPVVGGHEGAIGQLKAACEKLGEGAGVPAVLSRPSRVQCQGCGKFCACTSCVKAGRLEWHAHECRAFQALPPSAKGGQAAAGGDPTKAVDTSVLRLLLRFRVTLQPEVGEWSSDKESTTALTSLQRNPVNLDRSQLATLASLTGVTSNDAGALLSIKPQPSPSPSPSPSLSPSPSPPPSPSPSPLPGALISMVRTNACQVERNNGKKAGCALSALVGWHNHDCAPNAAATVMGDGRLSICALRDMALGEEVPRPHIDLALGPTLA